VTMLFIMGILLVFTALALAASAVRNAAPSTGVARSLELIEAMTTAPTELKADLDKSFGERVLIPLQNRFAGLGRRLSGADSSERIRRKLDLAGNPPGWTVDRVMSGKVVGAIGGLAGGLLFSFMLSSPMMKLLVVVGVTVAGFFAPSMYLYQRTYDRSKRMQRELPDAIDLLTISVESGLGFDAALQQVAYNTDGPLADEFSRVLREMQIGSSRSEALRALAERSSLSELRSFVSSMVQADAFGIPIANVLRVQSSEMRVKRRQRAEEKAQQVPVKMTIPLIFCILPALFIIVMGPAAIQIMDQFSSIQR
jgi:tight adherence protein C